MKGVKINKISDVLKEQGRSQKWLGAKLGMSQPAINALCRNRSQPSLKKLCIIADYLGVTPGELIEWPTGGGNAKNKQK